MAKERNTVCASVLLVPVVTPAYRRFVPVELLLTVFGTPVSMQNLVIGWLELPSEHDPHA